MLNNGIYIRFIKISECHMAGELIGLLRLLRLRNILRATIASKEFKEIWEKSFQREAIVLENNEFWKYLFTLFYSLYAPMLLVALLLSRALHDRQMLFYLVNGLHQPIGNQKMIFSVTSHVTHHVTTRKQKLIRPATSHVTHPVTLVM